MLNPPPGPPPPSFTLKKFRILQALSVPVSEYDDLSPKGSIDVGIRELIDEINGLEGCVTTSSCAGRISVFLEGRRKGSEVEGEGEDGVGGRTGEREGGGKGEGEEGERTAAGVGGKGGGGRWLFVSHDPVVFGSESELTNESGSGSRNAAMSYAGKSSWTELLGMQRLEGGDGEAQKLMESAVGERRLVHFKFEPMILHVLTSSLTQAQTVLSAALQAGFRESGALNLTSSSSSSTSEPPTPMVGIRSMGLALESVIGFESHGREICMVPEWQLKHLIDVSNQRFVENTKRIERFRTLLRESGDGSGKERKGDAGEWEDAAARRERKRAEGMRRAEELRERKESKEETQDVEELLDGTSLAQNL